MHALETLSHPVVAALLRGAPYSPAKLACAWRVAVGSELARVTRVTCEQGRVDVTLDDDRWLSQLKEARQVVLARLQAALGSDVVSRLEFITPEPSSAGPRRRTVRQSRTEEPR